MTYQFSVSNIPLDDLPKNYFLKNKINQNLKQIFHIFVLKATPKT